jgi:hypothetical protein
MINIDEGNWRTVAGDAFASAEESTPSIMCHFEVMTIDVMGRYFAFLRTALCCDQARLFVMLEMYSVRRAQVVRGIARLWHIILVSIPTDCADRLQPGS